MPDNSPSTGNPSSDASSSRYLPAMLLLFVGSGCAALIYEIVWYQMLQLVIGLTTLSLGLLLGSFMGGMCLGSLLYHKFVPKGRHPLKVYAALELGIGIIGLLVLWGMPLVGQVYTQFVGVGFAGIMLRGLVAAICLVPPTLLMGATLPAVSRWVETTPSGISWLGFFYGGNIAGAVFGCLLAGFYLLRVYDMATATYTAFAINIAVSLLAFGLASMTPEGAPTQKSSSKKSSSNQPPQIIPGAWAIYVATALSGLTALGAEVVWTRLLSLLLGATVYTFSIILAIFLAGLGIGSAVGSLIARTTSSSRVALGICQLFLCAAIGWTAFTIVYSLPYWPIDPTFLNPIKGPWYLFQMDLAIAVWAVMPGALLWGASFPLALGAVASRGQDPGKLVGGVYAANTLGAIIGALAFSIVLVPAIGTQDCQRVLIVIAAISAFVVLAVKQSAQENVGKGVERNDSAAKYHGISRVTLNVRAFIGIFIFGWMMKMNYDDLEEKGFGWAFIIILSITIGISTQSHTMGVIIFGTMIYIAAWIHTNLILTDRQRCANDENARPISRIGVAIVLLFLLVATPLLASSVGIAPWRIFAFGRWAATYGDKLVPGIRAEKDVPQNDGTDNTYCVYMGEGLNGSVAVSLTTNGIRSFHSAGKVQASNDPRDMRLQRLLGHISALAFDQPKDVLVVACGAGVTAGTFLLQPSVQNITICDIEPLVPKYVTPMFTKENYGITDNVLNVNPRIVHTPVGDKKVTVVYDDGRHFIRTTKQKFDIISSDPIDPWVKGCAALNTIEYYQMCKDHLNPGGVMSLWIPLYESNMISAKSLISTFFTVFDNGIIWSNDQSGAGYDAVLFGQANPTHFDVDELQARLNKPEFAAVKQSLKEVGFNSASDMLSTYAGRAPDMQGWMKDVPLNTDANMRLQYLAGMAVNSYTATEILNSITQYYKFPTDMFSGKDTNPLRVSIELPRHLTSSQNSELTQALLDSRSQSPSQTVPPPQMAPAPQPAAPPNY